MHLSKVVGRFYLFSFILLVIGLYAQAQSQKSTPNSVNQLSDEQVMDFFKRAQASGMSEMQIEQAALARGYTLSDIARMRQRISEVQNKKNSNSTDKNNQSDTLSTPNGRKQIGELSNRELLKKRKEVEDSLKTKVKKLEIYGSKLFQNHDLTFEPNLRIATPKNYQLGPDDELVIDIFGNASDSYRLEVSPEGTVKLLNLSPIFVSGLTIEEAKDRIVSRLRQAYAGLNSGGGTYAVVNLGNIRSIKVNIIGEVKIPGSYTVSSLATAFNALYLCGGPDSNGTYRNIRILRNNKLVRTIDLYQFLLTGEQSDNIVLQDQDIIQVPFYSYRIELDGEVKRRAIYELKDNETLEQLMQFAGGFASTAYKAYLTGRRATDREIQVLNIPLEELKIFKPQNGDRFEVGKILDRYSNRVQIQGAVFRPGDYALTADTRTFLQVLKKADGLKENAFRNRGIIYREKENGEPEIVSIDINKILKGESADIELQRQDSIVVKTIKELREEAFVTLIGEVNSEGDAPYAENMTVSDLILIGGGFTEGAIGSRIEIARRVKELNADKDYKVEIIKLDIDPKLNLSPADSKFKLQPFDIVYIRKAPNYEIQRNVYVIGEVNYPGTYAIRNSSEHISDLLERTGGTKLTGYLPGALFQRKGERIGIDIAQIMSNPSVEGNITLEDGDTLIVPKRSEIVSINGAVLNPSSINFTNGYNFQAYLSQAGGYNERAQKGRAFITYANGFTQRTRRFLFFKFYPRVEPGSTIYVPFKPIDDKKSNITGSVILSFTSTLIIALATILRN
ncbi:SLBB domain-containing protein [Runella sp.]|uniref:SLBB domain-containing protein n=1 Tax=Runella sp. TaxID=1960881 RepID=UPI00261DEFD5|nr:SLBB domain-containing protein [Runella sp.]